jgi:hypothetical protein
MYLIFVVVTVVTIYLAVTCNVMPSSLRKCLYRRFGESFRLHSQVKSFETSVQLYHIALRYTTQRCSFFVPYAVQRIEFLRLREKLPTMNTLRSENMRNFPSRRWRLWFCCSLAPWWSRTLWSCYSSSCREQTVARTLRTPLRHHRPEDKRHSLLLTSIAHVPDLCFRNSVLLVDHELYYKCTRERGKLFYLTFQSLAGNQV